MILVAISHVSFYLASNKISCYASYLFLMLWHTTHIFITIYQCNFTHSFMPISLLIQSHNIHYFLYFLTNNNFMWCIINLNKIAHFTYLHFLRVAHLLLIKLQPYYYSKFKNKNKKLLELKCFLSYLMTLYNK